jgi:hypothetical protein
MARSCCTTLVSRRTGNLPSVGARPASFYFACGGAGLRKLILNFSWSLNFTNMSSARAMERYFHGIHNPNRCLQNWQKSWWTWIRIDNYISNFY